MAKLAGSELIHFHFFHYICVPRTLRFLSPDDELDQPLIHRLSTLLSPRHLQCVRTKCITLLSKFDFAPTSHLHRHPPEWRNLGVACDSFLYSLASHQILLPLPPTSVPGPASTQHPPCQQPTSDQNQLLGILPRLPDDYAWLSPLQSQLIAVPG